MQGTDTSAHSHRPSTQHIVAWFVLAFAAAVAAMPLLTSGYSCGHDFDFHLRSWMEAAAQWKAGIVRPVWSFHAAWNAGEPRLLFYPPLSWIAGALLSLVVPWNGIAFAFTFAALFLGGVTMHRLLARWTSPGVALLGGCLYMVNPYMLFCAYERTAYAELLAAAWFPLLLAALLRRNVSVWRVALAVALLWITNGPAGVMGCYTVLLIGGTRVLLMLRSGRSEAWRYASRVTSGVLFGFFLDSFYLLPFLWERRYITLTAALTPLASPDANYLYEFTSDEFHNGVLLHSSNIAIALVSIAAVAGGALLWRRQKRIEHFTGMAALQTRDGHRQDVQTTAIILLIFSAAVLLLQLPVSSFVWHHGPQLKFLQFPWRFLAVQGAVTTVMLTLLIGRLLPRTANRIPMMACAGLLLIAATAFSLGNHTFRQGCDSEEGLEPQRQFFQSGEGFEQTDEYTPVDDDNDSLKTHLPEAWIAPTPDALPSVASKPGSLPHEARPHPDTFLLTPAADADNEFLIVRLRPFHGWQVKVDGHAVTDWPQRADGLLAVPLATAGQHRVEVAYRKPWDLWAGGLLSLASIAALATLTRRSGSAIKHVQ